MRGFVGRYSQNKGNKNIKNDTLGSKKLWRLPLINPVHFNKICSHCVGCSLLFKQFVEELLFSFVVRIEPRCQGYHMRSEWVTAHIDPPRVPPMAIHNFAWLSRISRPGGCPNGSGPVRSRGGSIRDISGCAETFYNLRKTEVLIQQRSNCISQISKKPFDWRTDIWRMWSKCVGAF